MHVAQGEQVAMHAAVPIVRAENEGEKRWFFGGGVHTWKATAAETGGTFILFEDLMDRGKTTPLHAHPEVDETLYVVEGEIVVQIGGVESVVGRGGVTFAPRGTPHAFRVTSHVSRVLTLQTPGSAESFFRDASEPVNGDGQAGNVDIGRVQASAKRNGGTEILGPPPFNDA
jgi:quercetin dioxygenase-like cupin family protein